MPRVSFEPRKKSLADIARRALEQAERPLYAGVTYKPSYSWKGEPIQISLPLVRWIDKK